MKKKTKKKIIKKKNLKPKKIEIKKNLKKSPQTTEDKNDSLRISKSNEIKP
jgi:hypothetical protein